MSLVPRTAYGRASGLERAGDNAGALIGPLLAAALGGARRPADDAAGVHPRHPGRDRLRGNGYGILDPVQSLGDLGASLVAGLLWALVSPTMAFGYAAAWMVAVVAATTVVRNRSALTSDHETEES